MTQTTIDFESLDDSAQLQALFMRVLYRAMETDDISYEKKTRELQRLYEEHGTPVDHALITLTGWSFESLLKFTKESRNHHLEHYCDGEEDYDGWDVDITQAL